MRDLIRVVAWLAALAAAAALLIAVGAYLTAAVT